jgi:hypothetical protein
MTLYLTYGFQNLVGLVIPRFDEGKDIMRIIIISFQDHGFDYAFLKTQSRPKLIKIIIDLRDKFSINVNVLKEKVINAINTYVNYQIGELKKQSNDPDLPIEGELKIDDKKFKLEDNLKQWLKSINDNFEDFIKKREHHKQKNPHREASFEFLFEKVKAKAPRAKDSDEDEDEHENEDEERKKLKRELKEPEDFAITSVNNEQRSKKLKQG